MFKKAKEVLHSEKRRLNKAEDRGLESMLEQSDSNLSYDLWVEQSEKNLCAARKRRESAEREVRFLRVHLRRQNWIAQKKFLERLR